MAEPEIISPRGVPPIRPDWLVDVAWRLADFGLGSLRSWTENGQYTLEDVVDGERWRFDSVRLSGFQETSVEHEADLFLPTDTATPTLRAGFQFTPWWDAERGTCVQARVEVGPRGAVTFDPENWFVLLPLPTSGEPRPAIAGVVAGDWDAGGPAEPDLAPGSADDLIGTAVSLADAPLVTGDRSVPEVILPSHAMVPRGGLLGRGKRKPSDLPLLAAHIEADGPLDANWTGTTGLDAAAIGPPALVETVETADAQVTLRTAAGVLTFTGPNARLRVARPFTP